MEKISGVIERITYQDEEKGFSVIKIKAQGYRELVTVVGNISSINIGRRYFRRREMVGKPEVWEAV